jgi:tetratricopeptide (TPR) repeat protein
MLKQIWTIIKLFYIHLAYFSVGLDQEHFYIARANYFTELKWFSYAIGNYKKALKESADPLVIAALGYCYLMVRDYEKSVKYYREAYQKSKNPVISFGLAHAELNKGNIEEAKKVLQILTEKENKLEPYHIDELNKLKQKIEALK